MLGQQVDQRALLLERVAADVIDQVVRVLAADVGAQAHHHGFGHHQTMRHVDVAAHLRGIDFQPRQNELGLLERTRHQAKNLGHGHPFNFPRAGRALVVGHHRVHQRGGQLTHHRDVGVNVKAGNRVALLRHGARRATAGREGLEHLGHFGLHEQLDVHGDLAQRAADDAQKRADFGKVVAHGVPRDQRLTEPQLFHEAGLGFHGAGFQRRQGARSAAEFAHQHARLELLQPLAVALDAGQDAGHLVAKSNRRGLLQIAAADDGRVAVRFGQLGQRVRNIFQVGFDQRQAFTDLQHGGGVGDVLRGRAPVAVLAELVSAVGVDLVDHGNDGVADLLGLGFELGPVDLAELAVLDDLFGSFFGDDAELALHLGQRALDVEVFGGAVLVTPDMPHSCVAEHVAEDLGVNDG